MQKLANAASNVGGLISMRRRRRGLARRTGDGPLHSARRSARFWLCAPARLIRPMLVVISCAMAIRLMADPADPIRHAIAGLLGRAELLAP